MTTMTGQLPIDFIQPAPFQRHSRTSRAAAINAEPAAGTKRGQALAYLRRQAHAGATDEEMQAHIPMNANTQRPRRVELVSAGLVRDSGRTRKTAGGDDAVVWVAAEFAPSRQTP